MLRHLLGAVLGCAILMQSSCGSEEVGGLACKELPGALGFEYFLKDAESAVVGVLRQGPPSPAELDEGLRMGQPGYVDAFVSGRLALVHSKYILRSKAGIDDTTMRTGLREVALRRFASYQELRNLWEQVMQTSSPATPGECLTAWKRCVEDLTPEWLQIDLRYSEVMKDSIGLMSRPNARSLDEIDLLCRYPE